MSKSRFVLKQARVSGGAASDLTRYVAKKDLDPKREGRGARPLFTERSDDLTFWEARKWLSITGGALLHDEVLHYILSFERPPDYENLGADDRERAAEIRSALRRALAQAAQELGVEGWRWAAGIHLNKPHPHVHILINKNAVSRRTGELTRVTKLLPPLVAHYREGADRAREFDYGVIINAFAESVDARIRERARGRVLAEEKARETTRTQSRYSLSSDRILLGKSMLARHEVERLSAQFASFERRDNPSPEAMRRLTLRLDAARRHHASLQPRVENLRARYKAQNAPLPLPQLSPAEVRKLQDAAVERRDAERVRVLEKIRQSLAAERGDAPRSEHERGRLTAQLREAETDFRGRAWREREFERSCHLVRFRADGAPLSLSRIDARLERARARISFIHSGVAAFFPSERLTALSEIERLLALRPQVEEQLHAQAGELKSEREEAARMVAVLREISADDARTSAGGSRENQPAAVPPIYTRAELARMEARAQLMHDAGLLLEVHAARTQSRARLAPEKREPLEALAARAFAREIVAEFDLKELRARHAEEAKRSRYTPVAAHLDDGSIVTGTLRQTETRTRADAIIRIVENSPEQRERFRAITRAAAERDAHARARLEAAAGYFAAAHQVAGDYRQQLARDGKSLPAPAFSEREMDRLDFYRTHGASAQDSRRLQTLLDREGRPAPTIQHESHSQHVR